MHHYDKGNIAIQHYAVREGLNSVCVARKVFFVFAEPTDSSIEDTFLLFYLAKDLILAPPSLTIALPDPPSSPPPPDGLLGHKLL